MQDNTPRNEKGQRHGYWERYNPNGQILYKGMYINGVEYGYWEEYYLYSIKHYYAR